MREASYIGVWGRGYNQRKVSEILHAKSYNVEPSGLRKWPSRGSVKLS